MINQEIIATMTSRIKVFYLMNGQAGIETLRAEWIELSKSLVGKDRDEANFAWRVCEQAVIGAFKK